MMRKSAALVVLLALSGCGDPEDLGSRNAAVVSAPSETVTLTATLSGTTLTVQSGVMPRGWWTQGGGFNAAKSPITLTLHADATGCSAAFDRTLSTADGTFTAITNPAGNPMAYQWSATADLAGLADHWHNEVQCDGSVLVRGCQAPRTVTVTLTVGGACLTAGGTCTATQNVSVASIQDADQTATNCECNIGPCVSACQAACANGDSACSQCCECRCKDEGLRAGNAACQPQPLCYTGSRGHAVCLPR